MKQRTRTMMATLLCGSCIGCVAGQPGGQVRRGLSQRKTYEWTEDGNFRVEGEGPQTERFTMMQGDMVMTVDADGNPVVDWENSTVAYYLSADPSADAAASTMGQALMASTAQVQAMSGSFDRMIALLSAGLLRTPAPAPPATAPVTATDPP